MFASEWNQTQAIPPQSDQSTSNPDFADEGSGLRR